MPKKIPKRIEVTWRDIIYDSSWMVDDAPLLMEPETCITVGFLVDENRRNIWVAGTFSPDGDQRWNGVVVIPKGCVVKRRSL